MFDRPGSLRTDQLEVQRQRNAARNLVLDGEQITRATVEPLRPQMRAALGINQLRVDPDLVTRTSYAALQYIAHTKLAADLLRVDRLVLVGESRIAGDHEHSRKPRQIGRQIVSDPVREILLLAVIAEVGKRQDDSRQAWRASRRGHGRSRGRCGGGRCRAGTKPHKLRQR
jgi:hypothetical protein